MKNKVLLLVQIISAVIFITAVICIMKEIRTYKADQKSYSDLNEKVITSAENEKKTENHKENNIKDQISINKQETELISVDFESLKAINQDCIGWIIACDEKINYPIVISESNDYYLKHGFDKKSNKAGCLFINQKYEKSSEVFDGYSCIIYGHNMKDGSMFHELVNFKDKTYMNNNSLIKLYIPNGNVLYYEVFAAYYMDAQKLPIYYDGNDEIQRKEFIKSIDKYCITKPDVNDKIITLITCEYSGNDYRMVVHAKLKETQ